MAKNSCQKVPKSDFQSWFSTSKIIGIFLKKILLISAIMASIWNVFIKFRWHDEKLTYGTNETLESKVHWWLVWGRSQKKNWKPHLCTYLDLDDLIHLVYLIDPWTPLNPPEPCWRYEIRGFASPSRIVLISADLHCYVKRL